ncbi:MAG: ArsR family transcriptional regulator [Candidatus Diapherotrites archaeon]
MAIRKVIIKVGGDMMGDLRQNLQKPNRKLAGTHTIYIKNLEELFHLLTPERLKLTWELITNSEKYTICDLAEKTRRKQAAVSRDIGILHRAGLIEKKKDKQKVYPRTTFKEILIQFAEPSQT